MCNCIVPPREDIYAAMTTTIDLQEQIEQLDLRLLQLLSERVKCCQDFDMDERADNADFSDMLALWIEEAGEQGIDEAIVEKMCKLTYLLCRKGQE